MATGLIGANEPGSGYGGAAAASDRGLDRRAGGDTGDDSHASGVSWAAIFAGAAVAAALALILLVLGAGLGFASVSPFTTTSTSAAVLGGAAIVWLLFTQVASSALGGYLAGRLRARWRIDSDEVYFRDTAHGLLAWSVATLVTAALLTSAIGGILGTAAEAGGQAVKGAAGAASRLAGPMSAGASSAGSDGDGGPTGYFVDSLFRADAAAPPPAAPGGDAGETQAKAEVVRIFANDLAAGQMGEADVRYVGQLVARRTGMAQADAEKRVGEVFTKTSTAINEAAAKAKQVADAARKAAAYAALWTFVGLLGGAFAASLAALYGGRRRDDLD